MIRWAVNRWHGRKKTVEEQLSYESVIALLEGIAAEAEVSLSGTADGCIVFESTGEIGEGSTLFPQDDVSSKGIGQKMAELFKLRLKPYSDSEKYWEAIHEIYAGNGAEKHYIEFTSVAPIKNSIFYAGKVGLGPFCQRYYANLDFLVEQNQKPAKPK